MDLIILLWLFILLVIIIICFLLTLKVYIKLTMTWCMSDVCLKGKTVIVTGANIGIGYETAIDLAKRGARVILACRNESKARIARDTIIKNTHNTEVIYSLVDFTSMKSVREFANAVIANEERLDVLVNNIGTDMDEKLSEDGLMFPMQVNYFAPVLLTILLLDMLKKSSGRIVNVSSCIARVVTFTKEDIENLNNALGRHARYPTTKLCNILFTIELASKLSGSGVKVYSLHPGVVITDIYDNLPTILRFLKMIGKWLVFKTPREGAQTSIYCAIADGLETYSGEHFHDCKLVKRYSNASNPVLAKELWTKTMELLNLQETA